MQHTKANTRRLMQLRNPGRNRADSPTEIALAILLIIVVMLAAVAVPGQAAAKVNAVNPTTHPRSDIITVTLPFAKGAYAGGPLQCDDRVLQTRPFGRPWPDGSHRFVRARIPARLLAGETKTLAVKAAPDGAVPQKPFSLHPRMSLAALIGTRFVVAGMDLTQGLTALPDRTGHLVRAYRSARRNGPLWAELTVEIPARLPFARWWLQFGWSKIGDPARSWPKGEVEMRVSGAHAVLDFASIKVLGSHGRGSFVLARAGDRVGDGQSHMISGRLLYGGMPMCATCDDDSTLLAEAELPVLAIADWRETGAYGPLGAIPPAAAGEVDPRAVAATEWRERPRHTWEQSYHCSRTDPSGTGAQPGFGVTALGWDVRLVTPWRLHGVRRSVYQEACRPGHIRDEQVRIIRERDHPRCAMGFWTPSPQAHDSLGKDDDVFVWFGGWRGYNPQHYMQQAEVELALLTSDAGEWRLLEQHVECWLFTVITGDRGVSLDKPFASRGTGRTLQTGTWLALLTGREDIEARIRARVDRLLAEDNLRAIGRHPNVAGGKWDFLSYWQLAIEARGLYHVHALLDDEPALKRANVIAEAVTMAHVERDGVWWLPYAANAADPNEVTWGHSNWASWVLPTVQLGEPHAKGAWQARARAIEKAAKAGRKGAGVDPLAGWLVR